MSLEGKREGGRSSLGMDSHLPDELSGKQSPNNYKINVFLYPMCAILFSLLFFLQVFVVELFAVLVANLYVNNSCYPYFPITNTLEIFKRKVTSVNNL